LFATAVEQFLYTIKLHFHMFDSSQISLRFETYWLCATVHLNL